MLKIGKFYIFVQPKPKDLLKTTPDLLEQTNTDKKPKQTRQNNKASNSEYSLQAEQNIFIFTQNKQKSESKHFDTNLTALHTKEKSRTTTTECLSNQNTTPDCQP